MTEEEKVENTIALKYITIKELKNIRTKVKKSEDEKTRLKKAKNNCNCKNRNKTLVWIFRTIFK